MNATDYIQKLGLEPHPEGGYYCQLFGNDETGDKALSTIYYLLTANDMSAFHRLHDMVEIWYFHAGEPLDIYVIDPDGTLNVHRLSEEDEMQAASSRSSGSPPKSPPNVASASSGAPSARPFVSRTLSWPKRRIC